MNDIIHVKLIAAVLYQNRADYQQVVPELIQAFSPLDYQGTFFPFVETDYYEEEMGVNLQRGIVSFAELVHPGVLAEAKLTARRLEDKLRFDGKRRINIDIGYLDMFKVVLASFKGRSNKIYLSDDVWADMILFYEEGTFKTFMWGFPDFKSGIYNADFKKIRNIYKEQLKEFGKLTASPQK